MKKLALNSIVIELASRDNTLKVKLDSQDFILRGQNIDTGEDLILKNFKIVNEHYNGMIKHDSELFDSKDIDIVSLEVVMYYLYMYNLWRSMYKKQENRDLTFRHEDFQNPATYDILFRFFKKYSQDWETKCSVLLGIDLQELKNIYAQRNDFYTK